MIKLHDYTVNRVIIERNDYNLGFLELSGRGAFHSQEIYGEGIIVAVVDTGVSPHSELEGRILRGASFVANTNNYTDDNGHGTHVAATVAGVNVGIAPKARILPVKVLDKDGNGRVEDLIRSLRWINQYRSPNGQKVNIVNMSLSAGKNLGANLQNQLHQAIKDLVKNDIAVIVSAGNTSREEILYPAAFYEVICVGAVDIERERALFSTMGNHIDVCQIGVDVISAWYKGGYASMSGTSMSAPIVSGIAALLACKHQEAFKETIKEDYLWRTIKLNTKDLGISGADREFGTGFCTLQPLEADIHLQNNSSHVKVNDGYFNLGEPIRITEGKVLIPTSFLAHFTGAFIKENGEQQTVRIRY